MGHSNWVLDWKLKYEKEDLGEDMVLSHLDTWDPIGKELATLTGKMTSVLNQPLAVEHMKTLV